MFAEVREVRLGYSGWDRAEGQNGGKMGAIRGSMGRAMRFFVAGKGV